MASKRDRNFAVGETVRIARKSYVIDRERANENIPEDRKVPIEQDVTGVSGVVQDGDYPSEQRNEHMIPVEISPGVILSVPEKRLERARGASCPGFGRGIGALEQIERANEKREAAARRARSRGSRKTSRRK